MRIGKSERIDRPRLSGLDFIGPDVEPTDEWRKANAATLAMVTARLPNDTLYDELVTQGGPAGLMRIGNCLAPGTIAHAVYSGHRFARELDDTAVAKAPLRRVKPRLNA